MRKLTQKSLPLILKLLEKYTFRKVAEILGFQGKHCGHRIRRLLECNDIDPRLYTKRRSKNSIKKFWNTKEYKTEPQLIRIYYYEGHPVKVYESRYAFGV